MRPRVGRGCTSSIMNKLPSTKHIPQEGGVRRRSTHLLPACREAGCHPPLIQAAPSGVDRSSSQSALSERSGRWNGRGWCGLASSHRSWLQVQVSSVMNNKHHSGRRLSPQASLSYKPPPLLASLPSLALRLLRACCPSLAPRLSLSRTHPGGGAPSCLSSPAVLRARSSPYGIGPPSSVCCRLAPSP